MDKKTIGKTLRKLRNQNGMKPEEVGAMVGLSGKTISGYESGQRSPDAELFLRLCDIYKVTDVMAEFYGRKSSVSLSQHEIEVVMAYRKSPSRQEAIDCLLSIEDKNDKSKELA